MQSLSSLSIPAAEVPILRRGDVAILGGSLAGVAAALRFARDGRRVVLIEPRTYLGHEITASLRPWLPSEADGPLWSDLLARMDVSPYQGEIPLKMDALKVALEDLLLDAGVDLLYASLPVAVLGSPDGIEGVVIANKSGRQAIEAPTVVDATETALAARLAGSRFEELPLTARYARTLEFDRTGPLDARTLPVPAHLGIAGNQVTIHRGYRGEAHGYVEFALDLPARATLECSMAREIAARGVSIELAAYLIADVPAFHEAALGAASYDLSGPQTGRLCGPSDDPFAGPLPGLWCLNEATRLDNPAVFRDPVAAARLGDEVAALIAASVTRSHPTATHAEVEPVGAGRGTPWVSGPPWLPGSNGVATQVGERAAALLAGKPARLEVRTLESPRAGRSYQRRLVPAAKVPSLEEADVLVVGGGTSGATAAITAAREGARVVLVEMNPGLGGTGTIGGVNSYWYGRHAGFSARVETWTASIHARLGHTKATWNIEAKMQALLQQATDAGVDLIWNALTFAALVEGDNRVRGVLVATRWGPRAILSRVTIDATGDGDVAAFAGAEFVYGSGPDHTTMWYSLAQFSTPGRTRNNFTSSVEISNVEDYTRAILAGRRRGNAVHDHGVYIAPRESRHILGDFVLTHTDQLTRRHWPDVVNIHYSNHDVKGPSTSPWVRMGLIPPNLEIEVPYRALIPRGLDGIIVTGKAVSATHDALAAIRMQADMENLGGVAALAAVQSLREGVCPRDVDVPALQRRLVAEGLLEAGILARPAEVPATSERGLGALVDAIDGAQPLHAYSNMEMGEIFAGRIPFVDACVAGPEIVPYLEEALAGARGLRRVHLAQALAYHGSPAAVPVLIEEIDRHLTGDSLPARENDIRHANDPPDQGAMPDAVYLLYSLGMTRDRRSLPVFARVVDLLGASEEDFRARRKGTFYYVEAIAWALEQHADPAAIPILRRLHAFPALRDQVCPAGFQVDIFTERQALLELAIAHAQARCGDEEGFATLAAYLDDVRGLLAASARSHLAAIRESRLHQVAR